MNMKNSLPNTHLMVYPTSSSYNDEEYNKVNVNSNENYLKSEEKADGMDPCYTISGSAKIEKSQEGCSKSSDLYKFMPMPSPYYNFKVNGATDPNVMNTIDNPEYPNLIQPIMINNSFPHPNNCSTSGYESVPISSNSVFTCSCAYCLAVYQNQWYMNYYGSIPHNQYILPTQADLGAQICKPFDNTFRPVMLKKQFGTHYTQESQEIDQKLAHLTPIYINQPVPSNTEHFQRRTPYKKRDHSGLSWLLLYLELEKDIESPTMNARIAWINDMHHIIYTKLTSGIISRWQYEFEFSYLKNIITQKSIEADDVFKTFPKLCHCGERFKSDNELNNHSNHCIELKMSWHRCLCGKLFDHHLEFFQHLFSGIIDCPMAVYHLWIFFEKYRRRRYKCFCSLIFHNFWVYYVHMGECCEYQNYFQRNCYFCQDSIKKANENSSFWSYPIIGPLKDLVRQSKIQ